MVIEAAERLSIAYVLFNQREIHSSDIDLWVKDRRVDGTLTIHSRSWPLASFTGVYVRLMDYHDLPENKQSGGQCLPDKLYKSAVFHEAFDEWLEMSRCHVLNRNSAMRSNQSKPYQAQFIARAGFRIPATLITNDPDEVHRFLRLYKRVIYKSISSVRSIVQELTPERLKDLWKIRHLPTQFQEFVPGTNIRVHVVANEVFATEIHTEAIDYRYAEQEGVAVTLAPVELPKHIVSCCIDVSRMLALPLCGIDLKRLADGTYYCFEVNPSPAYSYYQGYTGQPIAEAIVRLLHTETGVY